MTSIVPPTGAVPVACPPPDPNRPAPPPAPIPPGRPRDFSGHRFARTTGIWWRPGDEFGLRLDRRVGHVEGYGRWSDAVAAAAAASAGRAGAVAICDDRGRLYLYTVRQDCLLIAGPPLRIGARRETGYAFFDESVRGIVDGDLIATRGDCLVPWVQRPDARP